MNNKNLYKKGSVRYESDNKNRSIYKIGFVCDYNNDDSSDDDKSNTLYLIVSIPKKIITNVKEDSNIGYYYDIFENAISDKYDASINDYVVENIKKLKNYSGTIDIKLNIDELSDDELSDEENTTLLINPYLKKIKIPKDI